MFEDNLHGNLPDTDSVSEKQLRKIGETNFRDLFHKIVYVKSTPELLKGLSDNIEINAEDDGFLAYGYIDEEAGFSFRILCSANISKGGLTRGAFNKDVGVIMRRGQLNEFEYMNLDGSNIETSDFAEYISVINDVYKCENQQTEEIRGFTFLDSFRNSDYPDDIQVILVKDGINPEQVWVRCWAYTDNELFGKLLNEPYNDFGVHNGSIIGFAPVEFEDGLLCIYTGKTLADA